VSSLVSRTSAPATGAPSSMTRPAIRRGAAPSCAIHPAGDPAASCRRRAYASTGAPRPARALAAAARPATPPCSSPGALAPDDDRNAINAITTSATTSAAAPTTGAHPPPPVAPAPEPAAAPRGIASGPRTIIHARRSPPCVSSSWARSRASPSVSRQRTVPAGMPWRCAISVGSRPSA
jgi:hypothetical protein